MKTLYETKDGRVSNPNFQAFVEQVKQTHTPTATVHYYHLQIEGDKRTIIYDKHLCLDEKCLCGGIW